MSRKHQRILLLFGLLIGPSTGKLLAAESPAAAVSFETWGNELHRLAMRFEKGATAAQADAATSALRDEVAQSQEGRRVQIVATVADVKWRKEYTTVRVSFPGKAKPQRSPTKPLKIMREGEFRVEMTQDDALKIKPGMRVAIDGVVTFHRGKWGAVGITTNSQQICTLSRADLPGNFIGTFTTTNYKITIDGKPVPGSWAARE